MSSVPAPAVAVHRAPAQPRTAAAAGIPRSVRVLIRAVALVALVRGAVELVVDPLRHHFGGDLVDLSSYVDGARALARGGDPYAHFLGVKSNFVLAGFDYPPLIAWLWRPLATLSDDLAAVAWVAIIVACTVAAAAIVARTLLPAAWPRTELVVIASFLFAPATYNYGLGQMTPVVFLVLALALRDWIRGREVRCGAWIGCAASIKLAPAVLLVLLLRRKWWRGAAAGAATIAAAAGAGVLAVGPARTGEWLRLVLPVVGRANGAVDNQSWGGVLSRLVDHATLGVQPDLVVLRAAILVMSAAGVAVAAWAVRPGPRSRGVRGAEFGAGVIAMLLAGTISWYAHYLHLLIALAAAAAMLRVRGAGRALRWALATAVVATVAVHPLLVGTVSPDTLVAASRTLWWWPMLQAWSAPALSAAVLLAVLARTARAVA